MNLNNSENNYATQNDLSELTTQIEQSFGVIVNKVIERLQILENGQEANDKQMGVMAAGFGELAVLVEAIVGQMEFETDEARENFAERQQASRSEMFRVMNKFADELTKSNPGAASAVVDAAQKHVSPFNTVKEGNVPPSSASEG